VGKPVRALLVEDSQDDAELVLLELRRGGFEPEWERVVDAAGMNAALDRGTWDVVIADHHLPGFSGPAALEVVKRREIDLPFIVVSGSMGEAEAVAAMRAGARDYLMKDQLARLAAAVERELVEAVARRARRDAEDQLRHAQRLKSIGQLAGGLAHDFNNLLTVVIGSLQIIERRVGDDSRLERPVQAALRASKRGAELVQRLLAFSRKQTLRAAPLDVNLLIQGTLELMRHTLGSTIRIVSSLSVDTAPAYADAGQLESSLVNVAVNARDAMPNGGTLTVATCNVELAPSDAARRDGAPAGSYVMIAVTDTGAGMTREVAAQAFDPFFTTKAPGEGTGLGLSMVHGFVEQSCGHVEIESAPGRGTTIRLYLPRADAAAAEIRSVEAPASGPARGETILLVEDEDDVRDVAKTFLEELGYTVATAASPAAALALLEGYAEIDLVLTDVTMPGRMDGWALGRAVRERHPDLPVVYCSGNPSAGASYAQRNEPDAVLVAKPFTLDALRHALRRVLDGKREAS